MTSVVRAGVWSAVDGQERAVARLRREVVSGRTSHAYLFTGMAGTAPLRAALAFASALVCPDGGCGACEWCRRVVKLAHPDVELIEPAGMQLLVDQVRDAVRAAWRRPTAGPVRVVVVDQADRMNPNAQNAFLKALEEPPASTMLVLVAANAEALLPTVRSRCREIVFAPPGETQIASRLCDEGVPARDAALWARVGGSMERARSLASDEDERERRRGVAERVLAMARDPGTSLEAADWLATHTRSIRDRVAADQKAEAAELADWYRETKRHADDRARREQRRAEQDALEAALDDVTSVLRDLLARTQDPEAPLLNEDLAASVTARAEQLGATGVAGVLGGLEAVEDARRRLRANGNVLLTLEVLFLALHERLG